MTTDQVLTIFREAIMTMLKLSVPFLVVSIALGLIVAIFQAATQIHEQTITFVPKIIVTAFMMLMLGSWMIAVMNDLFQSICQMIIQL
ncbi:MULTISPECIES: flagellar biosynthetic protein FliQ [Caproicibacterium]|uniref:Flagellar biosynthetic protein FliQ n=1 Tax=Caproicibacterium argilliputei TaxID=3030016 RepID=A0AA97H0A9_9FIRM|nr:flagellar biosynthetic protein FliQ [Caproicibacterium argilliputei]WOC31258.1 flagellar biosynthetic protein FliQ [Caproicibacterium argilliputei]